MAKPSKVFLLTKNGGLSVMEESSYNTETVLQEFLARYPDLLGGDQINPDDPRHWLLIRREIGIPGEEDTGDRWSLDHLFVDQEGIPTFVECKRSSDTRARRQVVAQMLDYAANATQYWPTEKLRQSASETAQKAGNELDSVILSFLEEENPEVIETFWQNIEENLRTGRIRLIFVSDSIPRELKRIIEFLNEQMELTEVLAVEIKQFKSGDDRVMVPRVIGVTEAARRVKGPYRRRSMPWTIEEFEKEIKEDPLGELIQKLLDLGHDWEREKILVLEGQKSHEPAIILRVGKDNLITLYSGGIARIYYEFWHLPEDITERLQSELSGYLGNSQEIFKAQPNIVPLLLQYDPELVKFKPWLNKVISEMRKK